MKTLSTIRNRKLLATALVVWGLGSVLNAAEPTAFELIKEGNRHVGEEAKDRVVQIRSEKSVATLTPNIWYVIYFDPDATAKATEVKFGAGKKLAVKRPPRFLEPITGQHRELNRERMKIDSDKAIEIATKEPLLDKLTLTSTQLWLERLAWHSDDTPIWKVRVWAAKLRKPAESVDIGDIYISAEDGKVIKNDLRINRVD
jgi:hypothetical protein